MSFKLLHLNYLKLMVDFCIFKKFKFIEIFGTLQNRFMVFEFGNLEVMPTPSSPYFELIIGFIFLKSIIGSRMFGEENYCAQFSNRKEKTIMLLLELIIPDLSFLLNHLGSLKLINGRSIVLRFQIKRKKLLWIVTVYVCSSICISQ